MSVLAIFNRNLARRRIEYIHSRKALTWTDARSLFFSGETVLNGTPGSITDSDVRAKLEQILSSGASSDMMYEAIMDNCIPWVQNNHIDGVTAYDAVEMCHRAIDYIQDERKD